MQRLVAINFNIINYFTDFPNLNFENLTERIQNKTTELFVWIFYEFCEFAGGITLRSRGKFNGITRRSILDFYGIPGIP